MFNSLARCYTINLKWKNIMHFFISVVLLVAVLPTMSYAEEKIKHVKTENISEIKALPDDLRNLLSQEMQALQSGMMSIIPAYISGNWGEIETTAEKMKSSYILKQSLTKSQVKELHSALPHEFFEKDQRFHYLAGMLEHAAKNRKSELINFYFSEMNESCVSCHMVFATHKFPALMPKTRSKHVH
ncbi:conserved hypothetical protein [Abyssogena phaseoliformis symbiont OG214]|nr:conserved hypothetical protein [Abyssogena phaseoliformis symbiont OG214]